GVSVNCEQWSQELIHINGDGLPDHLRKDTTPCPASVGNPCLRVRKNLGRRFSSVDDVLPLPVWAGGATSVFDPLLAAMTGTRQGPDAADGGVGGFQASVDNLLSDLAGPDVIRRARTISLNNNIAPSVGGGGSSI